MSESIKADIKKIKISRDLDDDGIYCECCGACGEDGCCTPDRCKCLYGDYYKASYRDLLEENEYLRGEIHKLAAHAAKMLSASSAEDSTEIELLIGKWLK